MNFAYGEKELAFAAEVEQFLDEYLSDSARRAAVSDRHPEQLSQTVDSAAKREFIAALAERGWLGMSWPVEYGGAALSGIYDFMLTEALARRGLPQPGKGVGMVGKTIIRNGSAELKERFLPRIIRGEIEFAVGYSEPEAGSDAANMQLRAERDGDHWLLNGTKMWTTSAHFADWYWLGARTDPDAPRHRGITLFLIPMDSPGLEVTPIMTMGDERTNQVFFDKVRVDDDCVVGELNRGWTYICEALDLERFAMMPMGPLETKTAALFDWAREATRDGRPLTEDPRARRQLALVATELQVARALQKRVLAAALGDTVPTVESSQYKLFMNEAGQRVADTALDLAGVAGQLRVGQRHTPQDGRFERSYRYTVVDTIGGGTSEIQKNIIATRALGLPRSF
jgi:alkylation response protein AidB-like acyl-CoA dehydrogenase